MVKFGLLSGRGGFTLIELVMVIVIISVLAAVAIPRFVDLSGEAEDAALKSIAGSMSSASAMNRAACSLGNASCIAVSNCNQVGSLLDGGIPAGYAVSTAAVAAGSTGTCNVTNTAKVISTTFFMYGT